MPYSLRLPSPLPAEGWKVKIFDNERLEPPHITIQRRRHAWRIGLRDGAFLDEDGGWTDIDPRVRAEIERHWDELCAEWDRMFPDNPLGGTESDEDR